MNYITPEQIKEYVNQNPTGISGMSEDLATMVNHFAKLIVAECVQVCNMIYFDRYPNAEDYERSEEGDAIKQHFGVEE